MRLSAAVRATRRAPLLQVVKSAVATIAAWLLAGLLIPEGPPPVFAAIAALLVVQPSLNQSLLKAIERSIGVITGVVIASALGLAFGDTTWVVLVAVAAALLVAWALRMTSATANQVGISAMLVLALGPSTPDYALDRVLETLIGAVIGVIVNVALVPPMAIEPARRAVGALGDELAASLERLARSLERERTRAELEELMLEARLMRPMRESAEAAIETAADSLTLNPIARHRRQELTALHELLTRYSAIVTQVVGMTRAYYDHYDPAVAEETAMPGIAEQLRRAAHDVRLLQRRTEAPPTAPATTTIPALTAPLTVTAPTGTHWILIGSLLEDLRRIHDSLQEAV